MGTVVGLASCHDAAMTEQGGDHAGEFGVVENFLARARLGPAGLVIDGEAGIGKTTLWAHAVERGEALGFRVLSARAAIA
jgi:hypothetical protein